MSSQELAGRMVKLADERYGIVASTEAGTLLVRLPGGEQVSAARQDVTVLPRCRRCDGTGVWAGRGDCFRCGGSGAVITSKETAMNEVIDLRQVKALIAGDVQDRHGIGTQAARDAFTGAMRGLRRRENWIMLDGTAIKYIESEHIFRHMA